MARARRFSDDAAAEETEMQNPEPEIIEVDGGWAYRVGGATSNRYPSREAALVASAKHDAAGATAGDAAQGQDDGPRDLDNPTPS
jgi:hypothetical protein